MKKPLFTEGQRIELVAMGKDPRPVEAGTTGTVIADSQFFPNGSGGSWLTMVNWDNGRNLNLITPPDIARKIQ